MSQQNRKLIMWNVITLDGFFEGNQSWDLSFHNIIWGEELEQLSLEQLESADYLAFGRKTYEGMASYWTQVPEGDAEQPIARLMNSVPKLVFSKSLKQADWNNTTIINGDAAVEMRRLKEQGGKNIYVFGSAELSETFINDNLFDEYRIGISPVILGSGRPLFRGSSTPTNLSMIEAQPLKTGGIVLKYGRIG